MPVSICECRKCNTIYEDIDPSYGQKQYKITTGKLPQLKLILSQFKNKPLLICPKCNTDEFLQEK